MAERWSEEIEAYENALIIQRKCEEDMEGLLKSVEYFATNASGLGWTKMEVTDNPSGDRPFFGPDWWPMGGVIAKIITRWQKMDVVRRKAWEQMTPEDRVGLVGPSAQ